MLPPERWLKSSLRWGMVADETQAFALADKYKEPAAAHRPWPCAINFWQELTGRLVIETPDPSLNVMANGWLVYQTIVGRLWGRSAYYQTGGAYGFRDQLQDSLVWLLLGRPEKTLEQIRLHAAHQFQEGIVLHWWHPLAESGLRSNYSDDLLWLPFVVLHYLLETGDFAILEEEMPFFDGGSASLWEHCRRAFQVALSRRSERGLPLILEGDWNDGLNATGPDGQGESIWIAHFLYYLLTIGRRCRLARRPSTTSAMRLKRCGRSPISMVGIRAGIGGHLPMRACSWDRPNARRAAFSSMPRRGQC
jgi:cellobiose phosphorylase